MFSGERYIQFSIVLAANANNPTILNPDFLKYNNIVNKSWELLQPPICTQPFSQVFYKNKVSIVSQLDKVIFSLVLEKKDLAEFDIIQGMAIKYIETIPHVEYIGVGINPKYVIEFPTDESPHKFILNNFININSFSPELLGLGFVLKFSLNEHTICNLKIDTGKISESDDNREGIVIRANFHHTIKPDIATKIDEMNKVLASYSEDIAFFENEVIRKLFHKG